MTANELLSVCDDFLGDRERAAELADYFESYHAGEERGLLDAEGLRTAPTIARSTGGRE